MDPFELYGTYEKNLALLACHKDDTFFLTESHPARMSPCLWVLEVMGIVRQKMIDTFVKTANFLAMEQTLLRYLISTSFGPYILYSTYVIILTTFYT